MNLYQFLLKAHSGWRYIVMVLLLVAIIQAFAGWFGKKQYTEGNRKLNLFTLISAHVQLLLGLILYFVSPFVQFAGGVMKDKGLRYWTVEHLVIMILAIVLITIGHARSKRANAPLLKHKSIAIFYLIATIIIVGAIAMSGRPLFGMSS
ncbi:MAG: cytochrome B [Mucilaginibacter polytrichastri]|nr:cytochrome B [Mucilaginibacter polytrichastri]